MLVYHYTGLFLLRFSLGYDYADYSHAEAVVAFWRIVEAVVYRRRRTKPELKVVLAEAAKLKHSTTANEIRDIYTARSEAAAHGEKIVHVSRTLAAEAKLFAEYMVGGITSIAGEGRSTWAGRRHPQDLLGSDPP